LRARAIERSNQSLDTTPPNTNAATTGPNYILCAVHCGKRNPCGLIIPPPIPRSITGKQSSSRLAAAQRVARDSPMLFDNGNLKDLQAYRRAFAEYPDELLKQWRLRCLSYHRESRSAPITSRISLDVR
jgi:hypothetical protein